MKKEKDPRRELAEFNALKARNAETPDSEIITESRPEDREKLKGIKRLENFWYHYKWTIIGSVAAAYVLIAVSYSLITTPRLDVRVIAASSTFEGAEYIAANFDSIREIFEAATDDFNGDGKQVLDFYSIDLSQGEYDTATALAVENTRYQTELARTKSASIFVYATEEDAINSIAENDDLSYYFAKIGGKGSIFKVYDKGELRFLAALRLPIGDSKYYDRGFKTLENIFGTIYF